MLSQFGLQVWPTNLVLVVTLEEQQWQTQFEFAVWRHSLAQSVSKVSKTGN